MESFVIIALITFSLIGSSYQEDPPQKGCKEIRGAAIDEKWFETIIEWDAPMGSKVEAMMSINSPNLDEKKLKHTRCYLFSLNTPLGTYPAVNVCKYNKLSEQYCHIKTEGTPVEQFFKFHANFFFTKTDNETYVVAYGCGNVVDKFWTLYVAKGKVLDADAEKDIRAHVVELGFSADAKDMKSTDDTVSSSGLKKTGCDGMPVFTTMMDAKPKAKVSQTNTELSKDKPKDPALAIVKKLLVNPLSAYKVI